MVSQVDATSQLASTCDSVLPRLVCTCIDLHSLWSRSNLHPSWCKFFSVWPPNQHPTQVSASWVTPINLLSDNEIQDALKWVFCDFCALARKLASPFGHPTQSSTQVQLVATCDTHKTPCKSWMAIFSCHQYFKRRTLLHLSVNGLV